MSIIHEALKKAGEGSALRPQPLPIRRAPKSSGLGFGTAFFIIAVFIAGGFFATVSKKTGPAPDPAPRPRQAAPEFVPNTATPLPPSPPSVLGQFAVEEVPAAIPFTLSGVMVGPKGSYGIINNRVVEAGQKILGATVRSITDREVTLDYNGKKIILPVGDSSSI